MKRAAAHVIQLTAAAAGVWMIGAVVRGPFASPSLPRELATGAAVVGAAAALSWAAAELRDDSQEG